MSDLKKEELKKLYYFLYMTRRADEIICQLYKDKKLKGKPLSERGQEAISVGSMLAMSDDDIVVPSLRTRGAYIVKQNGIEEVMKEYLGKKGCKSGGLNAPHHFGDKDNNILPTSKVVGSSIPVAAGVSLYSKIKNKNIVVLAFFGDGASSRGDIHASMNFAAVNNLPIVFICENNQYSITTPLQKQTKKPDIADRAFGYGIPGIKINGQDIIEVYLTAKEAVYRARKGEGPTLIECLTYRFRGHSESHDPDDGRPKEELKYWRNKCPKTIFINYLIDKTSIHKREIEAIEKEVNNKLEKQIKKVEKLSNLNLDINKAKEFVYSK